jgi:co-chaperonin GroES (HSP10)
MAKVQYQEDGIQFADAETHVDLNTSGFWPIRDRALVLPDEVKEVTAGGIALPQTVIEKQQMRQLKATLIALGGDAFDVGTQNEWRQPLPKPGDRIYVKVAAGVIHPGEDGKEYRIINDADILGICEE